eukprot:GHRQ01018979.1.p1 GENE.GHRQ01018979.1~~GHRQ01018979.1.p1  ORF type:complete len:181 (-),score=23.36 GHRQ01018979.1:396-938(-)
MLRQVVDVSSQFLRLSVHPAALRLHLGVDNSLCNTAQTTLTLTPAKHSTACLQDRTARPTQQQKQVKWMSRGSLSSSRSWAGAVLALWCLHATQKLGSRYGMGNCQLVPSAVQLSACAFSCCFACVSAADSAGCCCEQVAIKKMERLHLQRYVESEILNHSQLRHPHVVQVRHVTATYVI